MKNTQKFFIIIIVGIVSISGCIIDYDKYPEIKPNPETDPLKLCNMIKELRLCKLIKDNETGVWRVAEGERNCIVHLDKNFLKNEWNECIALITLNESLCINSYCYIGIAKAKKDPEICKFVDNKNLCYEEVAKTSKNEKICVIN